MLALSGLGQTQAPGLQLSFAQLTVILLREPAVQKEVGLTAAQKSRIEAEYKRFAARLRELTKAPPKSQAEGAAANRKLESEQIGITNTILSNLLPAQRARLKEIGLQSFGPFAMTAPDVAKDVGITKPQAQGIKSVQDGFQKQMQALQNQRMEGVRAIPQPKNPNDKAAVEAYRAKLAAYANSHAAADRKQFESAKKQAETRVLALLSAAQKSKWTAMQGKPFKFPVRP